VYVYLDGNTIIIVDSLAMLQFVVINDSRSILYSRPIYNWF